MQGIPGMPFNIPMIYFNESSAAVKLLNCCLFGTFQVSIRAQFDGSRGNKTSLDADGYDRHRRVVLGVAKKLATDPRHKGASWTPILYQWEPYSGYGNHDCDWGNIVFTDGTLSKFLMIDIRGSTACPCCPGPSYEFAEAFGDWVEMSANRFLNLATYLPLPNKPKWVRATFTTMEHPDVDPAFFDFDSGSIPCPNPDSATRKPPIFHLPAERMTLAFKPLEVDALTSTILLKGSKDKLPAPETRNLVTAKPGEFSRLRWVSKNPLNGVAREMSEVRRRCEGCGTFDAMSKRLRCSRCKLSFYCSAACQRAHWPEHKPNCPVVPKA